MPTLTQLLPKDTILRIGASGPMVKAVQLALAKFGYPLKGSGYFGTETLAAVRAFQARAGVNVDGAVGEQTAAALDRGLKSDRSRQP